jgi:exodeoxyribonuclease-3
VASVEQHNVKSHFLHQLLPYRRTGWESRMHVIICGDWNSAQTTRDVKTWQAHQRHAGVLPAERTWRARVFAELGWVEVFRLQPEAAQDTWWSSRGSAWDHNVGWRLDSQVGTPDGVAHAQRATVYTAQRVSDHAPLMSEYGYAL